MTAPTLLEAFYRPRPLGVFTGDGLIGDAEASAARVLEGFELARECADSDTASLQSRVASLIYAYRDQGHRLARTNPLAEPPATLPDLELQNFGFEEADLDRLVSDVLDGVRAEVDGETRREVRRRPGCAHRTKRS